MAKYPHDVTHMQRHSFELLHCRDRRGTCLRRAWMNIKWGQKPKKKKQPKNGVKYYRISHIFWCVPLFYITVMSRVNLHEEVDLIMKTYVCNKGRKVFNLRVNNTLFSFRFRAIACFAWQKKKAFFVVFSKSLRMFYGWEESPPR